MSDLVGNTEDRFSRVEAQISNTLISNTFKVFINLEKRTIFNFGNVPLAIKLRDIILTNLIDKG